MIIPNRIEVKIKKADGGTTPSYGSMGAAGADLYSRSNVAIPPHTTAKVSTGIYAEIPVGCFGGIFARSGIATKKGLRPSNCVGVIDSDYRGEIIVPLHNDSSETQMIYVGDRVAQLIIIPYFRAVFTEKSELDETKRGDGGFGSTGK